MRVLASVGLDHVEGVGVARGRRGVPLALVVHLPVDQHQRTCEFKITSFNKEKVFQQSLLQSCTRNHCCFWLQSRYWCTIVVPTISKMYPKTIQNVSKNYPNTKMSAKCHQNLSKNYPKPKCLQKVYNFFPKTIQRVS